MNVTTAVIFASGFGTRMLPVTAAVPKDLLPVLDRPVVDYIVSDAITAGIKRFIFVVRPDNRAFQDYFLGNYQLEEHLKRHHKNAALERLHDLHSRATFEFVMHADTSRYGTAAPLQIAAPHLPDDEAFLVSGGDDFIWHTDGTSELSRFVDTFHATNAAATLMTITKPREELHKYGVFRLRQAPEGDFLVEVVEKPAPGTAPSDQINILKHIFTPQMMPYVMRVTPDPVHGEYLLTDAFTAAAKDLPVSVHRAGGRFMDAGSLEGWLEANLVVVQSQPHLQKSLYKLHGLF